MHHQTSECTVQETLVGWGAPQAPQVAGLLSVESSPKGPPWLAGVTGATPLPRCLVRHRGGPGWCTPIPPSAGDRSGQGIPAGRLSKPRSRLSRSSTEQSTGRQSARRGTRGCFATVRKEEEDAGVAHVVAEHPFEWSGETVQRGSQSAVSGGMEASECHPVHEPAKPGRRMIPPVPLAAGPGHQFRRGLDQPDLRRLLRRFASFGRAALRASVTRRTSISCAAGGRRQA